MLSQIIKILKKQRGFTLIELMTVLIILGVILGIGVPKYLQVQAVAAWEADETTIKNYAKAAEVYAASINTYGGPVSIDALIDAGLISDEALNRINDEGVSEKNEDGKTIAQVDAEAAFTFNLETGAVNNLGTVIKKLIGPPPHGEKPTYPADTNPNPWS